MLPFAEVKVIAEEAFEVFPSATTVSGKVSSAVSLAQRDRRLQQHGQLDSSDSEHMDAGNSKGYT